MVFESLTNGLFAVIVNILLVFLSVKLGDSLGFVDYPVSVGLDAISRLGMETEVSENLKHGRT